MKIMNANFEESLNILDDGLIQYMIKDTKKRSLYNGKSKIGVIILSILMIGSLYGLVLLCEMGVAGPIEGSPVPQPTINFLPMWLFVLFLLIWLSFWWNLRRKRYLEKIVFIRILISNIFIIWLYIELDLFFLTFILKPLTIFGTVLLFVVVAVGYLIIVSRHRDLKKQLFNTQSESNKIDQLAQKIVSLIFKYGWIIVILFVLWKLVFPDATVVRTDLVGFIGIVGMMLVANIGIIGAEAYLFLPYLLHGYYKCKYAEEYREWEGKTQLEWYGEKYFNKYIKGTVKEKKRND